MLATHVMHNRARYHLRALRRFLRRATGREKHAAGLALVAMGACVAADKADEIEARQRRRASRG